jgi:16S rRNA (guanine527-N7)-methyltransferase
VEFASELDAVLPPDLPHRDAVIHGAATHLEVIVEANKVLNLTRITTPREAAIKHVLDSVIPWPLFQNARQVLDAGTGAGFPGIPLAMVLPDTHFILAESIQKKARFVESALKALHVPNVEITRALAPISKILTLFRSALEAGSRLLLYKGPDVATEIAEAGRTRVRIEIAMRYELPDSLGARTIVSIAK